ncbi:hypothetical protein DL93DRAFT_2170906 [Clavulina sp. PMI_390]|nr:hypothetical protein DL93DRAFT_2170906 [Clavulina sp. PMI_390]
MSLLRKPSADCVAETSDMQPENDIDARARVDLIALLSVAKRYVPRLRVLPTEPTQKLWETLIGVIDRSEGHLARLSRGRRAECYRALIKAGLVRRLVGIVTDFAQLEQVLSYLTVEKQVLDELLLPSAVRVFFSPSQPSWTFALSILARLSRKFLDFESFVPLAEWRKYGAQLVTVYRSSELTHPVEDQGEHAALSMVRFWMINSLSDILLSGKWEPSIDPDKNDVSTMVDALPLLFDILATIERPPSLQISRSLAIAVSVHINAVVCALQSSGHYREVPLTKLTGYSVQRLISICAAPIDDSIERFDIITLLPAEPAIANNIYTNCYIPELLEPLIDSMLLTRIVHLIRGSRDRPGLWGNCLMDYGSWNKTSQIDPFVTFLSNVQGHGGPQNPQMIEELMKTDILFLLEWWSLTAPPAALNAIPSVSVIAQLWSSLWGIITVQVMMYYQKFPRDPRATRWVVGLLWFMQAFDIGISSRGVYEILIQGQNDLEVLAILPWYRSYFAAHTTIAGFIVQFFFLWRYWSVSKNLYITTSLSLLVATTLAFAIFSAVRSSQFPHSALATLAGSMFASKLWLCFSATTDLMLAAALAIEMRRHHTGYSRTDSTLNRLAIYGVATGGVTATAVFAEIFMTLVANHYEGFVLIGIPLGGLYITTFLANLHTRSALRNIISPESYQLSATAPRTFGANRTTHTNVTVTSVVVLQRDE